MKTTTRILSTAMVCSSALFLVSCVSMHPGGLSDEEWYSLSPEKRAKLELQQERLNEQRSRDIQQEVHWNKQDNEMKQNNYERELSREAGRQLQGYGY